MTNRVTITLTIDLPDGVVPVVDYGHVEAPEVLAPLPDTPPPDLFAEAAATPSCPQHGLMKRWPAGVSKRTNKPYGASWRCAAQDCATKPVWDAA